MSHFTFRLAQPGVSGRLLLALAMFCPAAVAQTSLQCGTPVSGQFTSAGQIDRYTIAVNSGDVLAIRATDGYLELFDPAGKSVATAFAGSGQRITVAAAVTGSYLLLISKQYGSSYSVTFQRLNRPCGTSEFSCGQQKSGTVPSEIAMIPYAISANTGDLMAIRATDGYLELFDPTGKSVANAFAGSGQTIAVTAAVTGPHLLLISKQYGSSYSVTFQRLNRPCGASVFSCGEQKSGTVTSEIAMIPYAISAIAGDVMSIRATDGYLELFDPTGKSVATAFAGSGQTIAVTAAVTGSHLLLISKQYGTSYSITYLKLNGPCTTATSLTLTSLLPPSTTAGGPAFTLTANGSGFLNTAVVLWNGSTLATTFVNASQLTATVPASLIPGQGSAGVSVQNSVGVTTNALAFTINAPQVTLSTVSPSTTTAGGPAFILTANGSGFLNSSVILWNGSTLTTSFVNATQLTATVPANLIAAQGSANVSVQSSVGVTTNALVFTINAPQLTLSTVSPSTTTAGGPAFILTANGAGFVNSSAIQWNGSPLSTTFVNASQLTATVPANLIATQGNASIRIQNAVITSNVLTLVISPPQLTLTSVAPNSTTAGASSFTLVASGSGFLNAAAVLWNGSALSTTFLNANQLSATVPASLVASAGTASISVQNSVGVISNAVSFVISSPQLTLSSISPNTATAGSPVFTLVANGTGFLNTAAVLWNGSALNTTFVSGNQLTATVPANLIATAGNASISVQNSVGVISNTVTFVISSPQLTLSSISPNTATAGAPVFTLVANGSGFLSTAAILWNGSALNTTFVSGNQLTATVPANFIAAAGNASISVQNTFGVISTILTFVISSPQLTLSSISPSAATAGGPAFTLVASGVGFVNNSIVLWNGSALSTTFVSATQLTATVPANLVAAPGNASVSIQNAAGVVSNVLTFVSNSPQLTLSSLTPNSAIAGGPAFTLVANGTGFLNSAIVLWNGSPLSTTFATNAQLTAAVPANLIATTGTASVSVQNGAGVFSSILTFVTNPQQPGGFTILTPSPLPSGTFGVSYAQGLLATGGATPYKNWALTSGSLPPGLSLTAGILSGTGLLSGTPTSAGTFGFAVQTMDNTNALATKPFVLTITGGVTTLTPSGIVNSASYEGGTIAPGEIVTIFGSFPGPSSLVTLQLDNRGFVSTNLGGQQLLFDGIAAPMIYAVAGQASAIVPYGVSGKNSVQIQVAYQGQLSNSVATPVAPVAPGIFTAESSGKGPGAIVNQDGTVNTASNPAAAGSIVFVYATGEGQTTPGGIDGKPADSPAPTPTTQPVTASVGGASAQVLYAGGVPGLVAGLLQVNVQLPAGITLGNAVPIVLSVGGKSSQVGVTLAVR